MSRPSSWLLASLLATTACEVRTLNRRAACSSFVRDQPNIRVVRLSGARAFNARGDVIEEAIDLDHDGTIDVRREVSYTAHERIEHHGVPLGAPSADLGEPGWGVRRTEVWHRETAQLLEMSADGDGDGTVDSSLRTVASTAAGWPLVQRLSSGSGDDRWFWSYDPSGRVTSHEVDLGDDGSVDTRTTTRYGPLLVVETTDAGADGTPDRIDETEHHPDGRPLRHRSVWPGVSGGSSETSDFEYRGDLLVTESIARDGVPTRTITHDYDDRGRRVSLEHRTEPEGVVVERDLTIWDGACP